MRAGRTVVEIQRDGKGGDVCPGSCQWTRQSTVVCSEAWEPLIFNNGSSPLLHQNLLPMALLGDLPRKPQGWACSTDPASPPLGRALTLVLNSSDVCMCVCMCVCEGMNSRATQLPVFTKENVNCLFQKYVIKIWVRCKTRQLESTVR